MNSPINNSLNNNSSNINSSNSQLINSSTSGSSTHNSPYLDYGLNSTPYNLNSSSQTPPCNVPNMFTAAACAANSSKTSNSDFSFTNNNLNKKYLNSQSNNLIETNLQSNPTTASNLQSTTSINSLESNLDQTLFYGSTNGSTSLNKSTNNLQSTHSVKPHQTAPEFPASLTNNYANNFAPNTNAYNNWQPGKTTLF